MNKTEYRLLEEQEAELQEPYAQWRREYDRKIKESGKRDFYQCCFADARESFSEYAGISGVISFDVMMMLERDYTDDTAD